MYGNSITSLINTIEEVQESRNRLSVMLSFCYWRSTLNEFVSVNEEHRAAAKYAIWGEHSFFQDDITQEEAFQMETEYLHQADNYEQVYKSAIDHLDKVEKELIELLSFFKTKRELR